MSTGPIIVGTNGSESAERAVDRAGEIAAAMGVTVHVVNSFVASTNGAWLAAAGGVAMAEVLPDEQTKSNAEQIVSRSCRRLAEHGVTARAHVSSCEPAEALMAIAEGEGAQMIVVGNRGMTGARRVLGSIPNRISHHAKCGVLIVPTC